MGNYATSFTTKKPALMSSMEATLLNMKMHKRDLTMLYDKIKILPNLLELNYVVCVLFEKMTEQKY